jgi:hypothetical protein
MHRVAAKIAQKIAMFFEDYHLDPRARQKKTEHHPRGSAARDATARGYSLRIVGSTRHRR